MGPDDPWADSGSLAADGSAVDWTDTGPTPEATSVPAEEERYERQGLLGAGAMGRVWLAHDRRLGRQIALKEAQETTPDGPAGRRLLREAALCAQLEHPSIVPVHDVSADQGRLFYTMRVVRGRSLAEALSQADLNARLLLLRHLRAACEAVAWAHAHGVVHRDLKPSNIMIGGFGETQVVDWGLARRVGESAEEESPPDPTSAHLTRVGAVIGTPAYMSPEAAQGKAADPRSDVWCLGAVLYELLSGRPPFEQDDPELVISLVREARVAHVTRHLPDAPRELVAIVDRAMQPDPAARYADAGELAEDLGRYLDGRRVQAHAYTSRELLLRLMRAWRAPLLVGAVALALLLTGGAASALRVARERDRALLAEDDARSALRRSDQTLAASLRRQAWEAIADDDRTRSELLAARALRLDGSPEARGALAAWGVQARPRLLREVPLPPCDDIALAADGERFACLRADRTLVWRVGERVPEATLLEHHIDVGIVEDRLLVVRPYSSLRAGSVELRPLDAPHRLLGKIDMVGPPAGAVATPNGWLTGSGGFHLAFSALRVDDGSRDEIPAFRLEQERRQSIGISVHGVQPGSWTLQMEDGEVWHVDGDHIRTHRPAWVDPKRQTPLSWAVDGDRVGIGTTEGQLLLVDLHSWDLLGSLDLGLGVISRVDPDPRGTGWWLVRADRGLLLVHPRSGTRGPSLPHKELLTARMSDRGTVLTASDRLREWEIPARQVPVRLEHAHGITSLTLSPDGRRLGVAGGEGLGVLWDLHEGQELWRLAPEVSGGLTIKAVVPAGDHVVVANTTGPGPVIVHVPDGRVTRGSLVNNLYRRAVVGSGHLLLGPYARLTLPRLYTLPDLQPLPGTETLYDPGDLAVSHDGRHTAVVDMKAGVHRVDMTTGADTLIWREPDLSSVDIASDGHTIAVTGPMDLVQLIDTEAGAQLSSWHTEDIVLDLAFSPDGQQIAVARRDARAEVREVRTGTLLMLLAGHDERLAAVEWTPDGRSLLTGGWDGRVRRWDMTLLGRDPSAIEAEIEAAWGLRVEDILSADAL